MTILTPARPSRPPRDRELAGRFLARLLWLFGLYTLTLGVVASRRLEPFTTALVSVPLQVAFALGAWDFMRQSGWGGARFGLTLRGARRAAAVALAQTLVALTLLVLLKATARSLGLLGGGDFFALQAQLARLGPAGFSLAILLYVAFVVVQEVVARGVVQTGLESFLPGPNRQRHAVVLSSFLFALTHLHVSLPITLGSFVVSLWWGHLFARQRTLVGVVVSHALLGALGYFVIGLGAQ